MKTLLLFIFGALAAFADLPATALQSPAAGGGGVTQQFQLNVSDSSGIQDIATSWLIFTTDGSYAHACGIRFVPAENGIQILNDAGTAWSASVTMGSSAVLDSPQCSVPASSAYKTFGGNSYYFTATPTFKPSFYGTKTMLGLSSNNAGQYNPNPYNLGTWGTGTANYPSTFLISPAGGGSGTSGQFTFGSTSGAGYQDIATSWLIFTTNGGYPASCGIRFLPPSNTVQILNDAGDNWITGTLDNSQCTFTNTSRVVVGASSQNYTFTVNFKAAFSGSTKSILGLSSNSAGQYNAAYALGSWTIPTMSGTYTKGDGETSGGLLNQSAGTAIDALTGNTMEIPTSANPLWSISISTASAEGPDSINFNTPFTVAIRNAKPNMQVWAQYIIDSIQTAPVVQDVTTYVVLPNNGLVGTTDANGSFDYNSTVQPAGGDHSLLFYLSNAGTPPAANSDAGLISDSARAAYFGSVSFWGCCQTDQGPPPTYSAARRPQTKEQKAEQAVYLKGHIKNWIADGRKFLEPLVADGADIKEELAKIKPANWDEQDILRTISILLEVIEEK